MAASFENPSAWRLRSPNGNIPFKFISLEGSFEPESAGVTLVGLIPSGNLIDYVLETFPAPLVVGNLTYPQASSLPGFPGLTAKKLTFKSFDSGLPADPFNFDPTAAIGTYMPVVEINVEYGMSPLKQPDPADPRTFLEISSVGKGEYIYTTNPGAKWQPKTRNSSDRPDAVEPGSTNDPLTPPALQTPETVKDPTLPVTIIVPQTEWTLKWKQVPFNYFNNILIYRIKWCVGRVNSATVPLLFNALPETLLFTGYSYNQSFTWRNGEINSPPVDIELKFLEKQIIWNGVYRGHNDFWRPGVGWERLLIDGVNPTYQSRDMGVMFRI